MIGRPRLGIGWRIGPFRLYIPLLPASKRKPRRGRVFTHPGCDVSHRSATAAWNCENGE